MINKIRSELGDDYEIIDESATEYSDVDLLVDSTLRGLSFYGLQNDVVETLHKDVDLFDIRQFDLSSVFLKEILEKGIVIYEK